MQEHFVRCTSGNRSFASDMNNTLLKSSHVRLQFDWAIDSASPFLAHAMNGWQQRK
jgi:hypothetical protein